MQFPKHIQQAVDLGLLQAEGDQIIGVAAEEAETVLGIARLMEKIQPTTKTDTEDTNDQEAIVLCRVLTSASGLARELWSDLRIAVGVAHGQQLPRQLWSSDVFRAIGGLIDRIYTNEADGSSLISKDSLISAYPNNNTQYTSVLEFNQAVSALADSSTMRSYGDPDSEWGVALDLLRQARAKANFQQAQHLADQALKSDSKLEKAIEAQQQELMTCLGMLRGSVGNQGNAVDAIDDLLNPKDGRLSFIDTIMSAREQSAPISTGIAAMDLDMEGGVRRAGEAAGGRLFTLAARTGVGKCSALNTPIIMADGSVLPVQDVREGDLVLGPDGTPRLVYGLARGRSEMYRITQQSGDSYTVNDVHILSLRVTGSKKNSLVVNDVRYYGGDIVNVEVRDYLQLSAKKKHLLKGWKPDAVEFHGAPAYKGPLTPYLAGAYLGDGYRHSSKLTLSDDEIIDELRSFCVTNGYKLHATDEPGCTGCAISKGVNGSNLVRTWMRDNDFVGQGKHIPDSLKRGSIEQRLEVLAGVLDTDGCVTNNCFDITLKEKRFANDVAFVARSLGLAAKVQECQKSIKSLGFTGTYHRVTISGNTDKVPTRVARKQCGPRKQVKNALNTGIKVESVGIDDYYGFALEGPDRLYLMGDFTVTHNTVLGVYTAVNLALGGLKVGLISAELDKHAIYARVWSAATRVANDNKNWAMVGDIESPNHTREKVSANIMAAAGVIQERGGKLLIEDPWGADVEAVVNSLRSMKAKNPDLRCAVVDHFHVLARHKGAPLSEAAMLEERAYKLMNCAKQLEIDLIVLAQMNRVGMDVASSRQPPSLDQIRGTDALSHVSHAVWIVRRQPGNDDENANNSGRPLELWHAKTRGRQAYWNGSQIKGYKGFLDHSILEMDYAFCSVKQDSTVREIAVNR